MSSRAPAESACIFVGCAKYRLLHTQKSSQPARRVSDACNSPASGGKDLDASPPGSKDGCAKHRGTRNLHSYPAWSHNRKCEDAENFRQKIVKRVDGGEKAFYIL
jgi:hypothetical protein